VCRPRAARSRIRPAVAPRGKRVVGDECADFGHSPGAGGTPGHALVLHALGEQVRVGAFLGAQATGSGGNQVRRYLEAPVHTRVRRAKLAGDIGAGALRLRPRER